MNLHPSSKTFPGELSRGRWSSALVSALLCAAAGTACVRVQVHGDPTQTADALIDRASNAIASQLPLRVATYNVSLYDDAAGGMIQRLQAGEDNARKSAAVLQHVRPDIVLLNEFDYDADGRAADLFQRDYLEVAQGDGLKPLHYPHRYLAPVNTGVPSGLDLDNNGTVGGDGRDRGNDAWGYGLHPGQYGMLVLSKYPIETGQVRTFQMLKWSAFPDASRPYHPHQRGYHYQDAVWNQLRLSSKSHWDVPIRAPHGTLHFLVSHPTPPVFDGPEDRNGARNADEIKLWNAYLDNDPASTSWLCDDKGRCGGLATDARFVIAGDLNNDPVDGDGRHDAINGLIGHPRVLRHTAPTSDGAVEAATTAGGANTQHKGAHANDTGDFGPRVGNMRLDYVLPSTGFRVISSGVFWPKRDAPDAHLATASDHHLVWVDLKWSSR